MTAVDILNWLSVLFVLAAAIGLLLSRDWRLSLGMLAVQYLGVFWLVQPNWPIGMAGVKLVTGWVACAALGMSQVGSPPAAATETSWPQGQLFRLLASGLVFITAASVAPQLADWLGVINLAKATGSLMLIGMGLLHLGITTQPLRVIIALLTTLAGFEVLYVSVENSVLVAALLAGINLGLALVGSYLLTAPTKEIE